MMKVKAKVKNNVCFVKLMINHNMVGFEQAAKKGIQANFITSIIAKVGGKAVYEQLSSQYLAKNPIFKFKFFAKKGETVEISWVDLLGNSDTAFIRMR